jgi:hypothetical protein
VLEVLRVLVEDEKRFVSFNRETGVAPQHLRGLFPGLLKLSQLRIGGREPNMAELPIRQSQCSFAEATHRLAVAFKHVIGQAHKTERPEGRRKGPCCRIT